MHRNLGITFAGGGNRAFYQLGLMNRWSQWIWPRTAAIACCSAGACVATTLLAQRESEAMAFWKRRRAGVTRNLVWGKVLKGRSPAPHGAIYRDTLLHTYNEGGLERIQTRPFPIWILCASIPLIPGTMLSTVLGISLYSLEKRMRPGMIHPTLSKKLGFTPFIFDARECRTAEELAALVLASSATPPFTPVGRFRQRKLLDGGMIDNVPAFVAERHAGVERNLVLLTRPYPPEVLGLHGRRMYLAPSKPVPISRWDYTRPDLLEDTIAMGEAEAAVHRDLLTPFMEQS